MYSNYVWFYSRSCLIRQKFNFFLANFSLAWDNHQSKMTGQITTLSEIRNFDWCGRLKHTYITNHTNHNILLLTAYILLSHLRQNSRNVIG